MVKKAPAPKTGTGDTTLAVPPTLAAPSNPLIGTLDPAKAKPGQNAIPLYREGPATSTLFA